MKLVRIVVLRAGDWIGERLAWVVFIRLAGWYGYDVIGDNSGGGVTFSGVEDVGGGELERMSRGEDIKKLEEYEAS